MASLLATRMMSDVPALRECDSYWLQDHPVLERVSAEINDSALPKERLAEVFECATPPMKDISLNLQSLTDASSVNTSMSCLAYFNQHSSTLKRLQIRIPAGTDATRILFAHILCPRLHELTIWVESERSKRLQIAFMRNAAEHRRKKARKHNPIGFSLKKPADLSSFSAECAEYFNLDDIAKFIAIQPNLERLRIQTSTLSQCQWTSLLRGINGCRSLKHLEFRRLEAAGLNESFPLEAIAKHPTLLSVDVNGCPTMFNWFQLSERNSRLKSLSWSSSPMKLTCLTQLSSSLSLSTSSLTQLEISHTNLSGQKIILIAQMLQGNKSLLDLNLSNAQLNGIDGLVLTMGLKNNSTLQRLSLNDNSLLKSPCDLTFQGFNQLLSTPKSNIKYLDLSRNEMEPFENDRRCTQLFDGIQKGSKIKVIKLANKGTLFFDSLRSSTGWYQAGYHHPEVCRSLGNAMSNCQLTELCMDHNQLGNVAVAEYLAPALAANGHLLESLSLKRVGMGDAAMIAISDALVGNTTLKYLDVSHNCSITNAAMVQFAPCLATLSELQTLWFHSSSEETYIHSLASALKTQYSLRAISHEQYLPVEDRVLLLANRSGRKYLYENRDINDSLWPIILGRISHMPRVLALFLREKADLLSLARPPLSPRNKKRKLC